MPLVCPAFLVNMTFDPLNAAIIRTFGTSVSYQAQGQPSASITVVIDDSQRMMEIENSPYLHLFIDTRSLSFAPKNGDRVTVRGKTYNVVDVQVDQAGGATLRIQGRGAA